MTKTQDKFTIERVGFRADGNVELRGNLYVPATGDGPYPALTLSMGYGGVKEQCAVPYAEAFGSAGFVALFHDRSIT
jgi:hypothetical protein